MNVMVLIPTRRMTEEQRDKHFISVTNTLYQ